jgi:hypothetical protein
MGYCVNRLDTCTATDCGAGNACVTINEPSGAFRACLPSCTVGGACPCPSGQLCAGSFSGSTFANGATACIPGNASAIDGSPCVGFGDCAADSLCLSDALENPGGQCFRVGCTLGMNATCAGGDGRCIDHRLITAGTIPQNVCIDGCVSDADCRMVDGYRCVSGGTSVGNFCRHPQAGDACMVDSDCGPAALWDCKTGLTFPGGLCTPTTGCPTPGSSMGCSPGSSVCYDSVLPVTSDNVCVDRCGGPANTQSGCRPGYVCRDVNPSPGATVLGCVSP